jgi:hypothetical protein
MKVKQNGNLKVVSNGTGKLTVNFKKGRGAKRTIGGMAQGNNFGNVGARIAAANGANGGKGGGQMRSISARSTFKKTAQKNNSTEKKKEEPSKAPTKQPTGSGRTAKEVAEQNNFGSYLEDGKLKFTNSGKKLGEKSQRQLDLEKRGLFKSR